MVQNDTDVGDVEIVGDEIVLYNFARALRVNIIKHVTAINIYESLENNTLQADFQLAEGIELVNNLPIMGEEWIDIAIRTPERRICRYKFFVESVVAGQPDQVSTLKQYVLRCVTEDFLNNSCTMFSRRYKDLNYDEAVRQVVSSDLGSSKPIEVESTKGKFDYVVNRVRPFQVIDLLTERAVSASNKSSHFFFYEDNMAYRFVTLEYLIEQRKSKVKDFTFFHDTTNNSSPFEKVLNIRNILSYKQVEHGSAVDKVKRGALRNQFREFDVYRGAYWNVQEYINAKDAAIFKATDKKNDMNSSTYNNAMAKMPGVSTMLVKDGTRPEMEHNKNLPYKRAYLDRYLQQNYRIRVYGDTQLFVGDVIGIEMPEVTATTVKPKLQEYQSGNYVVRTIRHTITRNDRNKFSHYMILDLCRPNMKKAIG